MDNTYDLHAAANNTIEHNIPCYPEIPQIGSQVWPRWPQVRVFRKGPAHVVNSIKQPVGSRYVVLGNERPYFYKILLRATCAV